MLYIVVVIPLGYCIKVVLVELNNTPPITENLVVPAPKTNDVKLVQLVHGPSPMVVIELAIVKLVIFLHP